MTGKGALMVSSGVVPPGLALECPLGRLDLAHDLPEERCRFLVGIYVQLAWKYGLQFAEGG
jgi:hypothetical protein